MELGLAAGLKVKQVAGEHIDDEINQWLANNPDAEVIDIKFSASAQHDEWGVDALIIYRNE